MKSLYIINQPQKLNQALPFISEHDGILLIEDAVVVATYNSVQVNHQTLYVLVEDLIARGLKDKAGAEQWTLVDYPQFVELTLQYDKSVSWL
ncbi:sulfurtransferase complex subunit TusB [Kangiella koreensis]|uniref:Sulfur relay protein TusB/DsrH n=1 Tax=Kangiella koreensis (strain DSM 16069 / JCM 12317 / KCTC 12182 / SW-125) TaxID=523791 RepID=C7RCJ8_KANKD|nr:sulfurtransferase complex subunit TusB [Kangiella koreensis]ACV26990.1 sulfur relay protein TusB/DsrH [Kangiella koreensis DSM 16069]